MNRFLRRLLCLLGTLHFLYEVAVVVGGFTLLSCTQWYPPSNPSKSEHLHLISFVVLLYVMEMSFLCIIMIANTFRLSSNSEDAMKQKHDAALFVAWLCSIDGGLIVIFGSPLLTDNPSRYASADVLLVKFAKIATIHNLFLVPLFVLLFIIYFVYKDCCAVPILCMGRLLRSDQTEPPRQPHALREDVPEAPSLVEQTRTEQFITVLKNVLVNDIKALAASECSICLDTTESSTKMGRSLLKCGHAFHTQCIQTWLEQCARSPNLENATCPNCRFVVTQV